MTMKWQVTDLDLLKLLMFQDKDTKAANTRDRPVWILKVLTNLATKPNSNGCKVTRRMMTNCNLICHINEILLALNEV